ncbi:CapA family protein [Hasllibacter sp. MH4015]|uniref:CapA family protein n=1 Tax=Hasllibacter sp. MH4015 TaxID=2854029 RepID=UPI001CD5F1FF|nr:CapA family protein [Hasllibacter sp. MH4015]
MFSNVFRGKAKVCIGAVLGLCLAVASCAPSSEGGAGSCARPDLVFGGDVLLHQIIQSEAAARPTGFAPAFEGISAALSRADLAIVNLEGPAARDVLPGGRQGRSPATIFDNRVYSGYPQFNFHPSIATVLASAGVDVVQTANNHALDRGALGVDRTLEALRAAGLSTTGTRARGEATNWAALRQVNGQTIAFLSCTFSTNGLRDGRDQVLGCYGNAPSIPNLIQSLNSQPGVDGVILLPHWGTEYSRSPNPRQRRLAQAAADAGAIAVVGAHPHVLQPLTIVTSQDGRQVPVAYSLGNLISSQWALERRTGALLYLDIGRDEAGRTRALNPRYLPTRVERFVERGVAVFPAATLPNGPRSIAHARAVLGDAMVGPDGCLAR